MHLDNPEFFEASIGVIAKFFNLSFLIFRLGSDYVFNTKKNNILSVVSGTRVKVIVSTTHLLVVERIYHTL